MSTLHIIDHPLIQHKLTIMREERHQHQGFQRIVGRNFLSDGL